MRRVRSWNPRWSFIGALFAAACGKVAGLDDFHVVPRPASSDGGSSPKWNFSDDTCRGCMTSHCTDPLAACTKDALCAPWERCTAACALGDDDCLHGCFPMDRSVDAAMFDVTQGDIVQLRVEFS